ncbi:MAG TPA: hypothetical protein VLH58_06470 [Candidatus Methylomirabilis sp.]|nr:hypothetical protein [Candidatus Methylomirabilis sp.]
MATVSLGVVVACGGIESHRDPPREFRRLEADFDQAWQATIRTLKDRGYDIRTMDLSARAIETGWLTFNPDYAATVFVTQQEDRYSICGKPSLGQAFRAKQVRLVVTLQPTRRGETGLRTEAFFRTQRYDTLVLSNRPLGEVECTSRGRLEEELRAEIQIRALSDHLDRLRRGAH